MKPFQHLATLLIPALVAAHTSPGTLFSDNPVLMEAPLVFDLSTYEHPQPRPMQAFQGVHPEGTWIRVNNQYVERGGKPWIPAYGEFHYSRFPEAFWEEAILKMKAAGLNTIASYTFWNHHEEVEGEWDWSGNRNLRKFVELCAKHGMDYFARIGPWSHGEARWGGHPDWLIERCTPETLRSTHPDYLDAVEKLYAQVALQLEGLLWKDGGPVYAIQLDNENWEHGPGKGVHLMEAEKRLALKYGMDVPIYTCTGWANTEYPQGEIIPSYGGYADFFWSEAQEVYRAPAFSFSEIRADGEIGTDMGLQQLRRDTGADNPYFTCEVGVGMAHAYHRRTTVTADDNTAVAMVKLGSGCNALGLFMFHGGANPMGKRTRLNELIENGYNDITVFSHDWQAAIGEFGQVRESFHRFKPWLGLLRDFGEQLAPMQAVIPPMLEAHPFNSTLLQRAVRTDGTSGFLFVNNHFKHDPIHTFEQVGFEVRLADASIHFGDGDLTLKPGAMFAWPFNLDLDGAVLKSATAQPFARLEGQRAWFFFQNEGLRARFVFAREAIARVEGQGVVVTEAGDHLQVDVTAPGLGCRIVVTGYDETQRFIHVLTEEQAQQSYVYEGALWLCDAEVLLFNAVEHTVTLISEATENTLWIFADTPQLDGAGEPDGFFTRHAVRFAPTATRVEAEVLAEGASAQIPQRFIGDNVRLKSPEDSLYADGLHVRFAFEPVESDALYDLRLRLDYAASCARFYVDGAFVYDNFYNGEVWELSARHLFPDPEAAYTLEARFLPLQPDDPIYVSGSYWPDRKACEPLLRFDGATAVPVYRATLDLVFGR